MIKNFKERISKINLVTRAHIKFKCIKEFLLSIMLFFFYFYQALFWLSDPLPIISRIAVCKIDCEFMIPVFLIAFYFQYYLHLPLVSLSLTFILKTQLISCSWLPSPWSFFFLTFYFTPIYTTNSMTDIFPLYIPSSKMYIYIFHKPQPWQKVYIDTWFYSFRNRLCYIFP